MNHAPAVLFSGSALLEHPYPGIPEHWYPIMKERAHSDLALITRMLPEVAQHLETVDPDADVEDFWEDAARTAAAIRVALATGQDFRSVPVKERWDEPELAQRLGPVSRAEESQHSDDPLLMHPVLVEHGGRWMVRAGFSSVPGELAPEEDAVSLLLQRAHQGVSRAVVKLAARKTGVFVVDLDPAMTAKDVTSALLGGVDGWEIVRLDGRRGALLLQDWIPMAYEYRLFVVDGRVVSGAGCIEEHTPYDRDSAADAFDPRMRRTRGNGIAGDEDDPVHARTLLMERYLGFGEKVTAQHGGTVVIDLALDEETDRVVVVELNTLPNAGLYASDVDAVYMALDVAHDRGYGAYALRGEVVSGISAASSKPNTVLPYSCGLCVYPSDIGFPGYDHQGPVYVNPTCPDHAEAPDQS